MVCGDYTNLNLTSIFSKVSQDDLAVKEKYAGIQIDNKYIREIPENVFGNLTFLSIKISVMCSSLQRIHSKAFKTSANLIVTLSIEAQNVISGPAPYSFYDLVNSFPEMERLTFSSRIGTLEEGKFTNEFKYLTHLSLRVDAIKGSPFSTMTQLSQMFLNDGNLNYIPKDALNVAKPREAFNTIGLMLSRNKLNGSSFEKGAFQDFTSKNMHVALRLDDNQIVHLDESIFWPFLNGTRHQIVGMKRNPLDCDDCRSAWICKSNTTDEMRKRIYAFCEDGNQISDCNNRFKKCK